MTVRLVVTGGPGAGKTALLEALGALGHAVVPEVARQVIAERKAAGLSHRPAPMDFAKVILDRDVLQYESVGPERGLVFFDRSLLDSLSMLWQLGAVSESEVVACLARYPYHPTAFILPPWREIYRTDDERDQTFDEAVTVYRALRDWYTRCGYNLLEVPTGTVANRRDFVLEHLKERANETDG